MTEPFIGQITTYAFNFAPKGWAACNGQLMVLAQNTALYSLIGTQYGGDGRTNFALPNFQARAVVGQGHAPNLSVYSNGDTGGTPTVTLTQNEMARHTHVPQGSTGSGTLTDPDTAAWGAAGRGRPPVYAPYAAAQAVQMNAQALAPTGGSQPHNNLQPYLALNFCIALTGIFPPRD